MNLNIRNVPPEIMRGIKLRAVEAELTIRGYCLARLGELIHIKPIGEVDGNDRVVQVDTKAENQRAGDDASVPVLRVPKSSKKRLRAVQPLRNKLAGRGGLDEESEDREIRQDGSEHEGHRVLPNGTQKWCADCRVNY